MITICGGKWTTYRHMAEDCVNQAATLARLAGTAVRHRPSEHPRLPLRRPRNSATCGCTAPTRRLVRQLEESEPAWAEPLDDALPYTGAEVVWAVRHEMARTVEDVLARRTRALFLNARAAMRMAPRVAELMARELQRNEEWAAGQLRSFRQTAQNYLVAD